MQDLAEFIDALGRLRLWAGGPSYRTLARRVGRLLKPPQTVAHTTVTSIFQPQRRRLDIDLVTATVRALGLSEPEATRWRQACVRVHADAKTEGVTGVLRQLPADSAAFTGRKRELDDVLSVVTARSGTQSPTTVAISAIEGMAGVGKTQLAVHAAHRLVRAGRFTDAQLYANLRGFDPERPQADPAAVLDAFLRQLGVPGRQIPETLDERATMFRDRTHGRHVLVLLDNAADADHVRDLIPSSPTCLVLITSRRNLAGLDGATRLWLDAFSASEAVELLAVIGGHHRISAEPEAARRVAELCGRLPLAVALAAARLRSRPTWSVAELAGRLEQDGIDAVAAGERPLRAVFDLSYRGLPASARRVFALLGLYPGEDFTHEAVAALVGVGWTRARETLELLQDEHLVQQRSPGRYSLHDLLRDHAAHLALEQDDTDLAVHRLLMFYLDSADRADRHLVPVPQPLDRELPEDCRPMGFDDREQALRWFDAEYQNLLAALRSAAAHGHHTIAAELPVMMGGYFILRANSDDWIAALRLAVDSATQLGDAARLGGALNRLGGALTGGGKHEEAAEALSRAVEIGRTLEDGRLWTTARTNLAVVQERLGNLDDAARLLHEALPDQRRLGNRVGEGVVLENLGKVSFRLADHEAAVDYCRQAIAIYRQTNRDDELATVLNILGQVQRELGRLLDAEDSHRQALEHSLAVRSRRSEGTSLHQLGLTLRAKGDKAAATHCLRLAVNAYAEVGDPRGAEVDQLTREQDDSVADLA